MTVPTRGLVTLTLGRVATRLRGWMGVLGNVPVTTPMCLSDWRVHRSITQCFLSFSSVKLYRSMCFLNREAGVPARCWSLMAQEVGGRREKNKVKVK